MKQTPLIIIAAITIGVLIVTPLGYYLKFSGAQIDFVNANWQLTVTGLVENPLNLTLTDLAAMPPTTEYASLFCVDQPNSPVTQGNWTGVKLSYLLEQASVEITAIKIAFHAADGYSSDLILQRAMQDDVILAYQKDSVPLSETLRLVVPGNWGYKWISQITNMELVNYDYLGRWETYGFSDQASISTSDPNNPPDQYTREFPTTTPSASVSSSPSASPLNPTPTPSPTPSPSSLPSPSYSPSPVPTAAQTPSPSPLASATFASTSEPDSSSGESSAFSIFPYAFASGVTVAALAVAAFAVALRKRKKTLHSDSSLG
jgi:hypothetical protein